MAKKEQSAKFKKAPQAPRRFKSAYMFFSTEKHKSIRQEHGKKLQTTDVAKMVSQAWKNLPPEEREEWEEMARRDKARYEVEKTMYTGPWKVPATKARSQKDPNAPKRPMSAFLSYSNSKRAQVKADNPEIGNAEVSRILAKMWKEAPEEERKMHIEKEFELRQKYKSAIAIWRQNADEELKAVRKKREDIALQRLECPENNYHQAVGEPRPPNHHHDMSLDGQVGPPDLADAATHTRSPAMAASACGPAPPAPYASMGPMGMGFNATGDDSALPLALPSQQYHGSFVPTTGMGAMGDCGPMDPVSYGMMQSGGLYNDASCYPSDYGRPCNGFEQTHNGNIVGFYGAYYPPPPQMPMSQPDHNGMAWGGQYYGNRNGQQYPAPDGSAGFGFGGF